MRPPPSLAYGANRGWGNSEVFRNSSHRLAPRNPCSDFLNKGFRKLGGFDSLASGPLLVCTYYFLPSRLSAFGNLIVDIVLVGAKKKMGRPDIGRIVAAVEHTQSVRDGAIPDHVCGSMGGYVFIVVHEATISAPVRSASPHPATIFRFYGIIFQNFPEGLNLRSATT